MKNSQISKTGLAAIVSCLSALTLLHSSALADSTVVVTPSNMDGWTFVGTDSNGDSNSANLGQMVTGPATPPLGTGSAQLITASGQGDGSSQIRNTNYAGTRVDQLTSLSYSTYMTTNNGQQFPYIGLNIATGNAMTPDDILFFEPPYQTPATGNPLLPDQGPTLLNTWQTWNALSGGWWDNLGVIGQGGLGGVESLSTYLTLFPDATIVNSGSFGGVRMSVGYASADDNFDGNVDNFTIGVSGVTTTYDFEAPAAVPEASTWAVAALAAVMLIVQLIRARAFSHRDAAEHERATRRSSSRIA